MSALQYLIQHYPGYGTAESWTIRVVYDNRLLEECEGIPNLRMLGRSEALLEQRWGSQSINELKEAAAKSPLASPLCDNCGGDTLDGRVLCIEKTWCHKADCQAAMERDKAEYGVQRPLERPRAQRYADMQICTTSGEPPEKVLADQRADPEQGQHKSYLVLCEEDRAKGFVRPVRLSYIHVGVGGHEIDPDDPAKHGRKGGCGTLTTMAQSIAETYARDPKFYGSTFCCCCGRHLPVGEFVWEDGSVVGS